MKNEEQLRKWEKEWDGICSPIFDSNDQLNIRIFKEQADRFIDSLLLQAELNWLTAQIERGGGMRKMESDYDDEDKRNRRDVRPWNEALSDFLIPLIERKKEVERLLGKEEGV